MNHIIRHRTPDTGWAWVISLSIGAINGLTFGLVRSFGVFFFYLRREFEVSRQVASWPFALCTSCTYLTGPITGLLISYFHLRTIVCVGILFTSAGFASCFWVTDINQIVLLVGVVHGFGIGLSYMQTPVIIAQYFDRYTATATAISYAGGTVGSFIFPALIESVIANYGLKGSFLIIGGILLNGLPCAMLLRPPIPADDENENEHHSTSTLKNVPSRHSSSSNLDTSRHSEPTEGRQKNNSTKIRRFSSTSGDRRSSLPNSPNRHLSSIIARPELHRLQQYRLKRKRSVSGEASTSAGGKWLYLRKSSLDLFAEKLLLEKNQNNHQLEVDYLGFPDSQSYNPATGRITSTRTPVFFSLENINSHTRQTKRMGAQFEETELLLLCEATMNHEGRNSSSSSAAGAGIRKTSIITDTSQGSGNLPRGFNFVIPVTTAKTAEPSSSVFEYPSVHLLQPNPHPGYYTGQQQQQLNTTPILPSSPSSFSTTVDTIFSNQSSQPPPPPQHSRRAAVKHKYSQTIKTTKPSHFAHTVASILTNPMYLILLITHVSFQWAWMTYQMVIFDFGIDQQLSRQQSVSVLVGFAASDLLGRVTSGWMADRRLVKKNHIVSICILLIGFLIQVTSLISSYRAQVTLTVLLGFTCGVIIVLFNLLTVEYVGLDGLPVALGLSAFFVGVTSLARPYVIGLFRDVIGSYSGLFRFVGTLSFIAALLWLMEPFAILSAKRREAKGSGQQADSRV